jgi:hypothetical protein
MKNASRVFEEDLEHEILTGEPWPLSDDRRCAGGYELQAIPALCESG